MKKKDMSSKSVLVQLYENRLLSSKVNEALDSGDLTLDEIVDLCKEHDLDISKPTLSRYKKKREEHIETGVPLIELLDKRKKNGNIIDIEEKRSNKLTTSKDERDEAYEQVFETSERVYNDLEVLDTIIQKTMAGLQYSDTVGVSEGMRAIDLKAKITDNSMQGLSLVGLRELKLRVQAKTESMLDAILVYVPEEQHDELFEFIKQQEEEFYANLDLTEESKRITEAIEASGIDIDI